MTDEEILRVPADATPDEIRRAFRKRTIACHPDCGGSKEKYTQLTAAYSRLLKRSSPHPSSLQPSSLPPFVAPAAQITPAVAPMTLPLEVPIENIASKFLVPVTVRRHCGEEEKIYVPVPQGVDSGEYVLVKEKGERLPHGGYGDITFVITVLNDTPFQRQGLNLVYRLDVSVKEALCGFERQIRLLSGKPLAVTSTTPIAPGHRKIVSCQGIMREGVVGDLIVEINVVFPIHLCEDTRIALLAIEF